MVWRVVLRLTLCLRKKLRVASRYEVSRAEERRALEVCCLARRTRSRGAYVGTGGW